MGHGYSGSIQTGRQSGAIVTGAGRGLGQGIAFGLAEAGADSAAADVIEQSEIKAGVEKRGRRCATIKADLPKSDWVPHIINSTLKGLGRIDILFNNAGIVRRG